MILRRLVLHFPLTAMISAMIVWALHFVFVYGAVGLACERPGLLGPQALMWWLGGSTLLALAAVGVIGLAGWTLWQRSGRLAGHAGQADRQRRFRGRFMAGVAALLALLALISIAMVALPIVMQTPCSGWSLR
jgi:hypothetical protein